MTLPVWAGTFAVFAVLMVADLALTRKAVGWRAAATSSALWIAATLAFGGALWLWQGPATAGQYFAGYLLEKALSVDNQRRRFVSATAKPVSNRPAARTVNHAITSPLCCGAPVMSR